MLAVVVIYPIRAFASSNTGAPAGGEGVGAISGWNVSNISYQPSSDPSKISAVEFDLDSAARTVFVSLASGDATFYACANTYAYHWQCDIAGGMNVSSMDEARVVASNK